MTASILVSDFTFFVSYVLPIVSVLIAALSTYVARSEKRKGSERTINGLRAQFTLDSMILKLIENNFPTSNDEFRKSLMNQIDLIRIILDSAMQE